MSITQPGLRPEDDPVFAVHQTAVEEHLGATQRLEDRGRTIGGAMLTVLAAGTGAGIVLGSKVLSHARLAVALPYFETAQRVVNGIDDVLVPVGAVAVPAAIAAVGITKLAARFNSVADFADDFSSREPSSDGKPRGRAARFVRRLGMAATGAALATFTASISTEVTDGPNRTIEAFQHLLPGSSVVVQYEDAMPMVTSALNPDLERRLRQAAVRRAVATHSFSVSLGTYRHGNQTRTDLFAGIEVPTGSPMDWNPEQGCTNVPVVLDTASGLGIGDTLKVNGISTRVVGTTKETSAMNRIAGVMDQQAVKACLEQQPNAPSYGVTLETDPKTAADILAEAQQGSDAPAVAISNESFIKNSQEFWAANVQPITNVLALVSGTMAFMAMTGAVGARLLRNRRELAAMLADETKAGTLRVAELIRSAKDGLVATTTGIAAAVPMTIAANTLESGFKAGVGVREALIGAALGLVGTIGGGALSLMGLRRVADPEANTRA